MLLIPLHIWAIRMGIVMSKAIPPMTHCILQLLIGHLQEKCCHFLLLTGGQQPRRTSEESDVFWSLGEFGEPEILDLPQPVFRDELTYPVDLSHGERRLYSSEGYGRECREESWR